ncbi:bifunctional UDP-N-acetylmuramoyl-tripeptide:D-alanyl-D-alanine ligase/alanine racemase [Ekhidna sp.]
MLFSELQKISTGQLQLHKDIEVSKYSTDSRTLSGYQGEVFIAIKGKRNGHDYIKSALKKGVKNFIVQDEILNENANVLLVEDSLATFQNIARDHREKFQLPVIGITGSNGKTTVKEWISTLLSEKFFVIKSPKSYNSQIGVPLSLLEIRKNHELGVFEAGISQTGEMKKLQEMIKPTIGVFTNLGQAHDDGFASKSQKLAEKLVLFKSVDKVICRSDQPYSKEIREILVEKVIFWGLDEGNQYDVSWVDGLIEIGEYQFQCDFTSETQLENLTHAIVTCLEIGLDPKQIQRGINLIEGVPMRLELKSGINGCYILDDSYNNDEIGLKVALDYLESHKQKTKRTLILSDILHTGRSDEELYTLIAELLRSKHISRLIGVGPRIRSMRDVFPQNSHFFESTENFLQNFPDFQDEMIVVKGARDFALERVVQRLEEKNHGTVLEVNFESLRHNLNQYRDLIRTETKLMVMVKANAYGSGILEVANFLQHQRADMLGVAYVDEAIQLRKNGISIPIMIMNPHITSFEQFERYDLQAEIFSLRHFDRMLKDTQNPPKIHLKIDTGMHRLGFTQTEIPPLIQRLKNNPKVQVEGIFTHFSSSDSSQEDDFTIEQARVFKLTYDQIVDAIGYNPVKHACNSPAMVRWPEYHFDMVRLGIGLHGFDPTGLMDLRSTSRLITNVSQIQHLKEGDTVGYLRKGKVKKNSKVAVIPIGYEDGYSRVFGSGIGQVLIGNKLCPTIGSICMDMTMIDVTGVDVREGDEVVIFGEKPSIKELAEWSGTIPYEILTNVSNRVKRIFISE